MYKLLERLISLIEIDMNRCTCMLHCVWRPALHSPVTPIAPCIPSSNARERSTLEHGGCYPSALSHSVHQKQVEEQASKPTVKHLV